MADNKILIVSFVTHLQIIAKKTHFFHNVWCVNSIDENEKPSTSSSDTFIISHFKPMFVDGFSYLFVCVCQSLHNKHPIANAIDMAINSNKPA